MKITLQEAIDGKEIGLRSLRRTDIKWLMMELLDRNIDFIIINHVLKRI